MPKKIHFVAMEGILVGKANRFETMLQHPLENTYSPQERTDITLNFAFILELAERCQRGETIALFTQDQNFAANEFLVSNVLLKLQFLGISVDQVFNIAKEYPYLISTLRNKETEVISPETALTYYLQHSNSPEIEFYFYGFENYFRREYHLSPETNTTKITLERMRPHQPIEAFSHFSVFDPLDIESRGDNPAFLHDLFKKRFFNIEQRALNVTSLQNSFREQIDNKFSTFDRQSFSAALQEEQYSPTIFAMIKNLALTDYLYSLSSQSSEGFSVGYHTSLVLNNIVNFSEQVKRRVSPFGLGVNDFALFASFYEITKGIVKIYLAKNFVKGDEHNFAFSVMQAFCQEIGVPNEKIALFEILLKNDLIGQFRLSQIDRDQFIAQLKVLHAQLPESMRNTTTPEDLYFLMKMFHKVAAGSYNNCKIIIPDAKFPCVEESISNAKNYPKIAYTDLRLYPRYTANLNTKAGMHEIHEALKVDEECVQMRARQRMSS